jgi:hypothetical protein
MDFDEIWYLSFFEVYWEISSLIEVWQDKILLCMKTFSRLWQYLAEFFLKLETFQVKFYRKSKHKFYVQKIFFRKPWRLWDNVEKFVGVREVTDDNKGKHMHFSYLVIKDTRAYTHAQTGST